MARLIDADALKKALRNCQIESLIAHTEEKNVFDIIDEQPTAYDVEKVVEQLEEEYSDIAFQYENSYKDGFSDGLNRAIRIVKAGGKYE